MTVHYYCPTYQFDDGRRLSSASHLPASRRSEAPGRCLGRVSRASAPVCGRRTGAWLCPLLRNDFGGISVFSLLYLAYVLRIWRYRQYIFLSGSYGFLFSMRAGSSGGRHTWRADFVRCRRKPRRAARLARPGYGACCAANVPSRIDGFGECRAAARVFRSKARANRASAFVGRCSVLCAFPI